MAMAKCCGRRIFIQFSCKSKIFAVTTVSRSNHTLLKLTQCSSISQKLTAGHAYKKYYPATVAVRWASQSPAAPTDVFVVQTAGTIDEATLPPIPTPPAPEEVLTSLPIENAVELASTVVGEPALSTYGLAGWSPVGMAQQALEYIHVTFDIPWWGSIVIGTFVLRTLVFPLVIKAQRNAAKMANNMPQLQRLQEKMTEARQSGNAFESAKASQEIMLFMKEKKMNPFLNMLPPLAQAPLFISMFMGLRGMCNAPVESLQTGGMLWFLDLTVPDQFYILPIITSVTLAATIELGTDSARASSMGMMRYALRAMPLVIFPFTMNFPGAVLCYWVSTNFISLCQVAVLRIPKVRNYFQIEAMVPPPQAAPGSKKKGFVAGFQESMTNLKITRELNERENLDIVNFKKAGRAPIPKTFKFDPTKRPTRNELLAKKKEQ